MPGATVDLEWVENLDKDSRRQVATYTTSANGEIRLTGGADRIIEAFIYADGYEPRHARWNVGVPLVLDLTPRDATLSFVNRESAALVRIRPVGFPSAVQASGWALKTPPSKSPQMNTTSRPTTIGATSWATNARARRRERRRR